MSEEEKESVNVEETVASETPVEVTETQETQAEVETPVVEQPVQEEVDERGVSWKNRAMEYERKLNEVPEIIQKTVNETLERQTQQKAPEYTIDQLEQWAIDNPQYRPQAEKMKYELLQKNIEKSQEAKFKTIEEQRNQQAIRQQSENWVTNHPTFKECFNNDFQGNKVWNMNHPLTQMMSQVLNQPDPITGKLIKDRPDGLVVAAKLAFADYSLNSLNKAKGDVTKLKKDLAKVQRKTMVEGGGQPATKVSANQTQAALQRYNKTYSKTDIADATKGYLKGIGLLKEE
jgi:hypothetical protein